MRFGSNFPILDDGGSQEYDRLFKESQGFDVNSGGRNRCGGIVPLDVTDKEDREEVIRKTKSAIYDYNQKNNSDLQFVRLIKVNYQALLYYITFKACSLSTRQIKVYQALVTYKLEVRIFREKPNVAQTPTPKPVVPRTSTPNASKSISRTLAGAFLCFRNDVSKVLHSLQWKKCPRSRIMSVASRVWRSMSIEAKLVYRNTRSLKYEDITPFLTMDMQLMYKVQDRR